MSAHSSNPFRIAVHIGMVVFALPIGYWPPWAIVMGAAIALAFNLLLLPRLSRQQLERPERRIFGVDLGLIMYPAVLLLLAILFYEQQIFMAIGWGAMAFGDSSAQILGSKARRSLPWNAGKTWRGLWSFWAFGTLGTYGLWSLLSDTAYLGLSSESWWWIIVFAISIAALFETLPGSIDDNLVVPLVGACTAFLGYQWQVQGQFFFPNNLGWGIIGITAFAILSVAARKMDVPGGIAGWLVAFGIFLGGNGAGLLLLGLFFVLGVGASGWRKKEKAQLGLAQEAGGVRTVRHAFANGGVAALAGLLAWSFPDNAGLWLTIMAAALGSATGDTLSSELGNLYGRRYWDLKMGELGTRGQDGVISLEGTLIGFAGSGFFALIALGTLDVPISFWGVWLGGIIGNLSDSFMGAHLQRKNLMTNDSVNFASTLLAAIIGGLVVILI